MKCWIKSFVVTTILWAICFWMYLYRETWVSGEELRLIVDRSSFKSYASWYLYREDTDMYCMKLSRPIVPERFCVPKKDVEVRNSENGGSEIGVIGKGDFVLKKDRYVGAKEETF